MDFTALVRSGRTRYAYGLCDASMGLLQMLNPTLCAGLISPGAFSLELRFLKAAAAVVILIFLQITFSHTWLGTLGLERLEEFGKRIASRKRLCVFLVGFSLLVIRSVLIPVSGIPLPRYHDEYSYLL